MGIVFRPTGYPDKEVKELVNIIFVTLAEKALLDESIIAKYPELFAEWTENWTGKTGSIVRDGNKLYKFCGEIGESKQKTKPSQTLEEWICINNYTDSYSKEMRKED